MAMSLQIPGSETGRGMARRGPNQTESFYEVFWIIKFSFLNILKLYLRTVYLPWLSPKNLVYC